MERFSEEINEVLIKSGLMPKVMATSGTDIFAEKGRYYPAPAISDKSKIGYIPEKNLPSHDISLIWDQDYRRKYGIMVKPGKFFRHCFPELADQEISDIVDSYKAQVNTKKELILHDNDMIPYYYHENRYAAGDKGTLGGSCMAGADKNDYLKFYNNYDVSILCLHEGSKDKISGRALLWHNVYFPEIRQYADFMDRIYVHNDSDMQLFKDYAEKNGIVYKQEQNYHNKTDFIIGDQIFADVIRISPLVCFEFDLNYGYPYCDTMSYLNPEDMTLCNKKLDSFSLVLDQTDGEVGGIDDLEHDIHGNPIFNEDDYIFSEYHNEYIYIDEALPIMDGEDYIHEDDIDNFVYVLDPDGGETDYLVHQDDVVFSDYFNGFLLACDSTFCDVLDSEIHRDGTIFSELYREYIPECAAEYCEYTETYYIPNHEFETYQDIKTGESVEIPSINGYIYYNDDLVDAGDVVLIGGELQVIEEIEEIAI